ncbi:hypothetical protein GCM10023189_13490 [Nibrella saemangeumensis]|uniref:histidine kinase n=1 Tax=Nibrella saemangeumensis TaxID=1084526 RepID=A0ABP8MM78_9BACT
MMPSVLTACLLLVSVLLQAMPLPRTRTLTINDGLPNSSVNGVVQDRAGFIWLATADGLARYDGRIMKVFRHTTQANSLAESSIGWMQSLSDGTLLLQTRTGDVQRFEPATEQFSMWLPRHRQGRNKIESVDFAPDGKSLWALWRGQKAQHYDLRSGRVRYWTEQQVGPAIRTLHSLQAASNGRAFGHYDEGIIEFDLQTGRHRLLPYPGSLSRWMYRSMRAIDWSLTVERKPGELVIVGRHYLFLLDLRTGQYKDVPMPGTDTEQEIYGMRLLADGNVYICIANRIYRFTADNQFTQIGELAIPADNRTPSGMPMLLDQSGVLWLRTHEGGVSLMDLHAFPFQTYPYRDGWKSDLLRMVLNITPPSWVDSNGDSWTRFTYANNHLWFIDLASLYRCNPEPKRTTSSHSGDSTGCKLTLKADQRGHFWLYSNVAGLAETDSTGKIIQKWPNSIVPLTYSNPGLDVGDLEPMGSVVWMASFLGKGLFKYDLHQRKIVAQLLHQPTKQQSLPTNQLMCLAADPYHPAVLWIGTLGAGLARFDTQTGRFRTFSEQDGLPNNTITSLLTDRQGYLWAATYKGLVRLNPRTFHKRVFTRSDGLQDHEFVYALSTRLPDGRLAFGGRTGMTVFDPAALQENLFEPPVVLSGLRINNAVIEAEGPSSPLPEPINALDQLTLDHTQNFLTFEFAGLQYSKPEKIQYRYRLAGVDDDWVNAGTQNTANYTQLRPGRYTFEVMATNADGRWSRHVKQLDVMITPPFWATWWAYALYTLAFGGAVFGFVQFRIGQARQQQAMQLKQQEAEQLRAVDELKTRFFSNITHEFRTPLSLILSPTEKLLQETKHDTATRQTLSSVHRNARQLLRLINQLLDLSKLEAGNMTVSLARGKVSQFVKELLSAFQPLAQQKRITLRFTTIGPDPERLFDADKLEKIMYNLVSNALKFTDAGGQVTVQFDADDAHARLTVTDTGRGIPADKLPHIFDRFYQVDTSRTRAHEGTGIGLALVNELTELMSGTISVSSELGTGTRITIEIPMPLAKGHEQPASLPAVPVLSPTLSAAPLVASAQDDSDKPLMLVVEDNTELRDFIAGELTAYVRVLTAANGEEGWQLVQTELPAIVVSDVMMPQMDGYELTRLIKQTPATSHIAVVLLTAKAAHPSRLEGLQQGADDYLTKPFHFDELHLRLRNLLERQCKLRDFYQRQLTSANTPFRPKEIDEPFLREVFECIESRLDDSGFTVDQLAEMRNMSRRTLHRKLTALTNLSANDVIRNYRLKRASELLRQGHTVSETAYLVGFENPTYFSTVFKQIYQQTPSEFAVR